jgi:hypothetical protein
VLRLVRPQVDLDKVATLIDAHADQVDRINLVEQRVDAQSPSFSDAPGVRGLTADSIPEVGFLLHDENVQTGTREHPSGQRTRQSPTADDDIKALRPHHPSVRRIAGQYSPARAVGQPTSSLRRPIRFWSPHPPGIGHELT